MTIVNMRNGIPIVQSGPSVKIPRGKPWRDIPNPYTRYIEMGMGIAESHCYASIVMPYKFEWVQQYLSEGWTIVKEWTTEVVN